MSVTHLTNDKLTRAFEIIDTYKKIDIELADASVVVAEVFKTVDIFTFDIRDFSQYKIRKGYKKFAVNIIG